MIDVITFEDIAKEVDDKLGYNRHFNVTSIFWYSIMKGMFRVILNIVKATDQRAEFVNGAAISNVAYISDGAELLNEYLNRDDSGDNGVKYNKIQKLLVDVEYAYMEEKSSQETRLSASKTLFIGIYSTCAGMGVTLFNRLQPTAKLHNFRKFIRTSYRGKIQTQIVEETYKENTDLVRNKPIFTSVLDAYGRALTRWKTNQIKRQRVHLYWKNKNNKLRC